MPKRRLALAFGFRGSRFQGLQWQAPGVSTVEAEMLGALHRAGCVSAANAVDPAKIGWNRGSRTDRGVHAALTVSTAKLLVPAEPGADLSPVIAAVNAELPPDVRLFGAVRTRNSFHPRSHCSGRKYCYALPRELFAQPGQLAVFRDVLASLRGRQYLRNFTSGVKTIGDWRPEADPDFDPRLRATLHAEPSEAERQRISRVLLSAEVREQPELGTVEVHLLGHSFVYNQVRRYVGTALAVALGYMPRELLAVALDGRYAVRTPLAPADGLYLLEPVYSDPRTGVGLRQSDVEVPGVGTAPKMTVLLDDDADRAAAAFLDQHLRPVVRDAVLSSDFRAEVVAELEETQPSEAAVRDLVAGHSALPPLQGSERTIPAQILTELLAAGVLNHPGAQWAYVYHGLPPELDAQACVRHVQQVGVEAVARAGQEAVEQGIAKGHKGVRFHAFQ